MAAKLALWADIALDLDEALGQVEIALDQRVRMRRLAEADPRDAIGTQLGIGKCLDAAYSTVEAALTRLLIEVDQEPPQGPASHVDIIRRASHRVESSRPAMIPGSVARELDALRRFRHAYRHVYDEFDYGLADPNMDLAARCVPRAAAKIERFCRDFGITPPELSVRFPPPPA